MYLYLCLMPNSGIIVSITFKTVGKSLQICFINVSFPVVHFAV